MLAPMRATVLLLPLLALPALALAGCGVEQADECVRYVACQQAYDEAFGIRPATPTTDYDEGGRCWFGNPNTAEACAQSCQSTADALRDAANAAGQSLDACDGP